jgi:RNA polymerase sigma factor (TIGR02999 family)
MMTPDPQEVTQLLQAWSRGDRDALDALTPLVYDELRRRAHNHLRRERQGHTLQTTALINEVYLRLVRAQEHDWRSRVQFIAVCANIMRRVLIDMARARKRDKRGENRQRVTLDEQMQVDGGPDVDFLALDEALDRFAEVYPRKAHVVVLRFFGGMTWAEVAATLDISQDAAMDDWKFAQLWLRRELSGEAGQGRKRG